MRNILKYVSMFVFGVLFSAIFILVFGNFSENQSKVKFVDNAANIYQKKDNHNDGDDDRYRDYTGLHLTKLDHNVLNFILNQVRTENIYVYIENNEKTSKENWYIKAENIYGSENTSIVYYQKFSAKTFEFKDISETEFEKHEKEKLNVYSYFSAGS